MTNISSSTWSCSVCTYTNGYKIDHCKMCGSRRTPQSGLRNDPISLQESDDEVQFVRARFPIRSGRAQQRSHPVVDGILRHKRRRGWFAPIIPRLHKKRRKNHSQSTDCPCTASEEMMFYGVSLLVLGLLVLLWFRSSVVQDPASQYDEFESGHTHGSRPPDDDYDTYEWNDAKTDASYKTTYQGDWDQTDGYDAYSGTFKQNSYSGDTYSGYGSAYNQGKASSRGFGWGWGGSRSSGNTFDGQFETPGGHSSSPNRHIDGGLNYFDVLNLGTDASVRSVKKKYHGLAKKWHPDRCTASKEVCNQKMMEITMAYRVLSNKKLRDAYVQNGFTGHPESSFSGWNPT